jgi:hypothetical protein
MKARTVTGTQGMRCSLSNAVLGAGLAKPANAFSLRERRLMPLRLPHELRAAICRPRLILEMQPLDCLLS